jgi:hypothetical protein
LVRCLEKVLYLSGLCDPPSWETLNVPQAFVTHRPLSPAQLTISTFRSTCPRNKGRFTHPLS